VNWQFKLSGLMLGLGTLAEYLYLDLLEEKSKFCIRNIEKSQSNFRYKIVFNIESQYQILELILTKLNYFCDVNDTLQ